MIYQIFIVQKIEAIANSATNISVLFLKDTLHFV